MYAVARFRYQPSGSRTVHLGITGKILCSIPVPITPAFTSLKRTNNAAKMIRQATASLLLRAAPVPLFSCADAGSSHFLRGTMSSMHEPISVSTPKMTLSSGRTIFVTSITSAPAPNTTRPRRRSLLESGTQKPDSRIKVQQMLCCQM